MSKLQVFSMFAGVGGFEVGLHKADSKYYKVLYQNQYEPSRKAKNDALVATAKANAEAVKTQADADAYRVQKMQEALSKAGEGYFRNQSLDSFNQLAQGPNNLIVVGKDEMTDLGKVPALKKVWDASDDKKYE